MVHNIDNCIVQLFSFDMAEQHLKFKKKNDKFPFTIYFRTVSIIPRFATRRQLKKTGLYKSFVLRFGKRNISLFIISLFPCEYHSVRMNMYSVCD